MMRPKGGVQNPGVIDAVVREPETDEIVLAMLEDREWGKDPAQREELLDKVTTYLKFVKDGQLFELHPEAKNMAIRFDINYAHVPDEAGWRLIGELKERLAKVGISVQARQIGGSAPTSPE